MIENKIIEKYPSLSGAWHWGCCLVDEIHFGTQNSIHHFITSKGSCILCRTARPVAKRLQQKSLREVPWNRYRLILNCDSWGVRQRSMQTVIHIMILSCRLMRTENAFDWIHFNAANPSENKHHWLTKEATWKVKIIAHSTDENLFEIDIL